MKTENQTEGQPQVATIAVVCDGEKSCPVCGGKGEYKLTCFDAVKPLKCMRCHGTGKIVSRSTLLWHRAGERK